MYAGLQEGWPAGVSLSSIRNLVKDYNALVNASVDDRTKAMLEKQGWVSLAFRHVIGSEFPGHSSLEAGLWFMEDTISRAVLASLVCSRCTMNHFDQHFCELLDSVEGNCPVPLADGAFIGGSTVLWRWTNKQFDLKSDRNPLRGTANIRKRNRDAMDSDAGQQHDSADS